MSLNETPMAERVHIGFFGLRNAGKSSLVNRITNQEMSLVSEVKGTTTDPVKKSMELLPLGPVTIIDTPGFDDEGALGEMRVRKTREVLGICDIAVLVTEQETLKTTELQLQELIRKQDIPCLIVHTKTDLREQPATDGQSELYVSSVNGQGIEELKEKLAHCIRADKKQLRFVADLIHPGDTVVLVIPIDSSAPKGRLILPQQAALRDILDAGAIGIVTGVETLAQTLAGLKTDPALVITDSQAFSSVMHLVREDIPLTSFSILMARYKGFLQEAVRGAHAIDELKDGAKILISEGCTHHRQCEDIGTVKLPKWLAVYTGQKPEFTFSSGHGFPGELSGYDLIIHCGGCMLGDKEMLGRMRAAVAAGIPFTNYGTAIAHMNGILERSIAPINKD
ncbi:MAG: [FeFe] hydrogenase H-cluster maturation GTPase HydF [Lachnospiraceae bacterium]|nr:[FeFe] hydrogenase H-cluster maturation GTPase HydF [Lachnospiraceae bacterium]